HPHNSIHLSVPQANSPAESARNTFQQWKKEGIIRQDAQPGIYVYYQYFALSGNSHQYIRKGFICNIRAYDWDHDQVILRHEATIPQAVNGRKQMVETAQINISPTHGLYSDANFALEPLMDEAVQTPLYESEDYQGVKEVLAVIEDPQVIRRFVEHLKDRQVILADGHHRYEGSMEYRKERMAANPKHTGKEGYNFHMMYLTNMESGDLRILPTHRLMRDLPGFDQDTLMEKLAEDFHIKVVANAYDIDRVILGKKYAFGLLFGEDTFKIRLKEERYDQVPWKFPPEISQLDLTVMHFWVIEKALGILGPEQRSSTHIGFERNCGAALEEIRSGKAQMAIIMKDVSMQQVKEVCESGYTMPQKSTYFYPKVTCGHLFSSITDEDTVLSPGISI
ncbi:MAG TPA: DUF1015 domain-containing protein, partial [Cytophagales bacterium]|nr:DUF1015 domain-containing protein [Cytophagales bacterium]